MRWGWLEVRPCAQLYPQAYPRGASPGASSERYCQRTALPTFPSARDPPPREVSLTASAHCIRALRQRTASSHCVNAHAGPSATPLGVRSAQSCPRATKLFHHTPFAVLPPPHVPRRPSPRSDGPPGSRLIGFRESRRPSLSLPRPDSAPVLSHPVPQPSRIVILYRYIYPSSLPEARALGRESAVRHSVFVRLITPC